MTEAEWMTCTDLQTMVEFLRHKYSIRKFRLFAVACCRTITPLMLKTKLGYRALGIAEKLADGLPIAENLDEFRGRLCTEDYDFNRIDGQFEQTDSEPWGATKEDYVIYHASGAAYYALEEARYFIGEVRKECGKPGVLEVLDRVAWAAAHWERKTSRHWPKKSWVPRELRKLVPVVDEIFDNPLDPLPPLPSAILNWNDSTVRRIA